MGQTTNDRKESRTHNSTYPKGGVSCFADAFVQAESSVLRMKFSAKNPALRVAAKRYGKGYYICIRFNTKKIINKHMKMKTLLLAIIATLGWTVSTMAQNLPNYVPANGLVGWWPFNGNANDESGNGNNGTVIGSTLTADRFGNVGKAYFFNGTGNYISVPDDSTLRPSKISLSCWINKNDSDLSQVIYKVRSSDNENEQYSINTNYQFGVKSGSNCIQGSGWQLSNYQNNNGINQWHHIVGTFDGFTIRLYLDGNEVSSSIFQGSIDNCQGGEFLIGWSGFLALFFSGSMDDIGIWNRALTQEEITTLFNAPNCTYNLTISPSSNQLETGITANFTATSSDSNPSFIWQSDLGQGFQTLNNYGNYSGTNTSTLNISNIQLANHNQPIRVITISGECVDTSDIATISILDTCITSINDTTFITVTDTLVINTLITGINPPNNSNTIKVYPNPANSHITIEYGDYAIMNGYQLQIENSLGQQVFQTNITQQTDYLSLNNWGGNGLYFVHIIDAQGNTIDIRKIVLQ